MDEIKKKSTTGTGKEEKEGRFEKICQAYFQKAKQLIKKLVHPKKCLNFEDKEEQKLNDLEENCN